MINKPFSQCSFRYYYLNITSKSVPIHHESIRLPSSTFIKSRRSRDAVSQNSTPNSSCDSTWHWHGSITVWKRSRAAQMPIDLARDLNTVLTTPVLSAVFAGREKECCRWARASCWPLYLNFQRHFDVAGSAFLCCN